MSDKVLVPVDFCKKLIAAIRETNSELYEATGERYPDFESAVDDFESMIEAAPEPANSYHIPDAGKMVVSAEPVAEIIQNVIGVDIGFIHPKYAKLPVGTKLYASQPAQEWVKCSERMPDHSEPVIYLRAKDGKFSVGIAYWTVSQKWKPEAQSMKCPEGFTHWMPLPQPPGE